MKINRYIATGLLAAGLSAGSVVAQTVLTNSYTNSFANGGNTGMFSGGSVASWLEWYGLSFGNTAMQGDGSQDAGGDTSSGSLYLSLPFSGASQQVQIFGTFDNQYGYDGSAVIPVNIITNIGFDVHVDPSTTATDPNGNYGAIQMSLVDPGWNNGGRVVNFSNLTVPGAASNGWVHLQDTNIVAEALAMSEAGYPNAAGVGFYINSYNGTYPLSPMTLWIDNVTVQTLTAPPPPPPPPTLAPPIPTVSGLNVFNSTEGNQFFDRQEVELVNSHGLGWVGKTGSGPVSYSLTIKDFAHGGNFSGEAYLFLIPNPVAQEGAPDYNETNCAILFIQRNGNGGQGVFQYKVNENQGNNMQYGQNGYTNAPGSFPGGTNILTSNGTNVWLENGTLTNVQSTILNGTWTLTFTSDTNGMIIAPDGTTASFTIPSYYIANFQESTGFNIYLGGQANDASYMNKALVYSGFSVSGTGASDMSETFDGETTLDTNVWNKTYATGPAGVLIVPTNAPYWVSWSLPANGYSLINSGSLGASALWQSVSTYGIIPMHATNTQLIASADLRSPTADYFRVIKRTFSQMLALVPGETFTPGVAPGYSGSPTPLSLGGNPFVQEVVTVQAVDSQFNAIAGVNDSINIVAGPGSDPSEVLPATAQAMANGSTTFGNSNPFFFGSQGSWTITVTNQSNTNIPNATSASVTVGP